MDGLYYPFYFEECRHRFIKEVLNLDLEEQATAGVNIVLTEFTVKFKRSLKKGDSFTVSCSAHRDVSGRPQFHLFQQIIRDGKVTTEGSFIATCVPAAGGRPFLPDHLVSSLQDTTPIGS
jgi:acyl-CoA thioester hydrolase